MATRPISRRYPAAITSPTIRLTISALALCLAQSPVFALPPFRSPPLGLLGAYTPTLGPLAHPRPLPRPRARYELKHE
eukprot:scaffold3721_cov134-Isochrysis_galbana.AAC.3